MKVSLLVMDPLKNLIITGSEDKSLFFFKFLTSDKGIDMDPIRCVTLDFVAINFEWLSSKVNISILNDSVQKLVLNFVFSFTL